jgi:hypothetical protein
LTVFFFSSNISLFLYITAAKTANPSVFLFWDIFESKDAADAARAAFSEAVDPLELDTELIVEYEGTILYVFVVFFLPLYCIV